MKINKPFDVLVIEAAYEYNKPSVDKVDAVKSLANFCESHNIPVRVPNGNQTDWGAKKECEEDALIREYFKNCDYKTELYLKELLSKGSNGKIKILLTGGVCDYIPGDNLIALLESKHGLQLDDIFKLVKNDNPTDNATLFCCVAYRAISMYKYLLKKGKMPNIYIDGNSVVTTRNMMEPDSLYLIEKVSTEKAIFQYVIGRKITRNPEKII